METVTVHEPSLTEIQKFCNEINISEDDKLNDQSRLIKRFIKEMSESKTPQGQQQLK